MVIHFNEDISVPNPCLNCAHLVPKKVYQQITTDKKEYGSPRLILKLVYGHEFDSWEYVSSIETGQLTLKGIEKAPDSDESMKQSAYLTLCGRLDI